MKKNFIKFSFIQCTSTKENFFPSRLAKNKRKKKKIWKKGEKISNENLVGFEECLCATCSFFLLAFCVYAIK